MQALKGGEEVKRDQKRTFTESSIRVGIELEVFGSIYDKGTLNFSKFDSILRYSLEFWLRRHLDFEKWGLLKKTGFKNTLSFILNNFERLILEFFSSGQSKSRRKWCEVFGNFENKFSLGADWL